SGSKRIGFIAQEVEQVLPELVFTNPGDGLMGVNYAEMTAVLAEAIKEQQKIIDIQKSALEILEQKIESVTDENNRLAATLNEMDELRSEIDLMKSMIMMLSNID
ncbi:MAG: tail fiber domain-containing protein, partial [Bacteroidales bacterium]